MSDDPGTTIIRNKGVESTPGHSKVEVEGVHHDPTPLVEDCVVGALENESLMACT